MAPVARLAGGLLWHIRAGDITLTPRPGVPSLLRLDLGGGVRIMLDSAADDSAGLAAAMRRLAEVAAEAAEQLECRAQGYA
jgi:hypothetical protein